MKLDFRKNVWDLSDSPIEDDSIFGELLIVFREEFSPFALQNIPVNSHLKYESLIRSKDNRSDHPKSSLHRLPDGVWMKHACGYAGPVSEDMNGEDLLKLLIASYTTLEDLDLEVPVHFPLVKASFHIRTTRLTDKVAPIFSKDGIDQTQKKIVNYLDQVIRMHPSDAPDLDFMASNTAWILVLIGVPLR